MSPTPTISPAPNEKVQPHHRDRLAIVYVRQSTLQQVQRHQESTRLQYALTDRARALGWSESRIEVIDEDLGRSGTSAEGRPGFQRLVAEVGLDRVGIVLGVDMSRLSRSNRDWHQLLETCALFATLIGDPDGVYDPSQYNDRLLLGLKGTMSEAELHLIKQRLLAGKRAKAARGELGMQVPMGYVRRPSGEIVKDPDEQARATIELVFDQFDRTGTVNGVLRYLVDHRIEMPRRVPGGERKGELEWTRPNRVTLGNLLKNPAYAGAYVYGRRPIDPKRKKPGRPSTGKTVARPDQWQVLIKDHFAAYIDWARFERNLEQLRLNGRDGTGVARHGPSLLSGLLICGRCGLRMSANYSDNGHGLRYTCNRGAVEYGQALCQSLTGAPLDDALADLVLRALEPAALEVSLRVAEEAQADRQQLHRHWNKRLERARIDVDRASRQYDAVEPENRLVARTLKKQWEQALGAQTQLETEHERFLAEQPERLGEAERDAIRRLAADVPALWRASTTTSADRQAIIRQLVERVIVTVEGESEKVGVEIHWFGGHATAATVIRPVARLDQLSYFEPLLARVSELHSEGLSGKTIADRLNGEGWRPPKRRETFTASMVSTLLQRQGLRSVASRVKDDFKRRGREMTIRELALELDMPQPSVYRWLETGQLQARRDEAGSRPRWLVKTTKAELERLRMLRESAPRQRRQRR